MEKFIKAENNVLCMYEADVLEHFKNTPVFSLADLTQIIQNRAYAKKFLQRMARQGKVVKIRRDSYTLHSDPFLVSTYLVKPSYISGVSALSFHHLTTQIPKHVFCATAGQKKTIRFVSEIRYVPTRYFFGFSNEEYEKFRIPVATPAKAIIDSIGMTPLSVLEEAFDAIDAKTLVSYLKKIRKSSVVKRIGYMSEKNGFDVYKQLKRMINSRYIFLDPLAKRSGKRDKRWKVIVNG